MVMIVWNCCLCLEGYAIDSNLPCVASVFGVMAKVRILALSAVGTETAVKNLVAAVNEVVSANDSMSCFQHSHFYNLSDCVSKVAPSQVPLRDPHRSSDDVANFELSHLVIEMAELPFLQTLQRSSFTH